MSRIIRILLIFLLFPFQLFAQEKNTIIWIQNDFPPVWISEGPSKGTGGGDLIQKLLMEKLKGYNHFIRRANVSRLKIMMKNGEKVCACAKFKTPDREKIMYFNQIPSSFILSNGIITLKEKRLLFGNDFKMSLANTLKNKNLRLGITQDRKYGGQIDQILKLNKGTANIYERVGLDNTEGLLNMLLTSRLDYILGYDWELQYMLKQSMSPQKADSLIFLPIQEIKPYLISYIACSKTEWGRSVLGKIDEILREETPKEHYIEIWEQWMSNKKLYRKLYKEFFLKGIQ